MKEEGTNVELCAVGQVYGFEGLDLGDCLQNTRADVFAVRQRNFAQIGGLRLVDEHSFQGLVANRRPERA